MPTLFILFMLPLRWLKTGLRKNISYLLPTKTNISTTCSLLTVGKSSRKASIVIPLSRWSKRVSMGTLVPL
jgi:hypothetical protein